MIAQFCESNHRTWDQLLPELVFAVNSSRHESTGFSPAFLNYGREMEMPGILRSPRTPHDEAESLTNNVPEEHLEAVRKLTETFELVRLNLGRAYTSQSRHYNLRHRDWRCHVGDKVMKREHHLSSGSQGFAAKLAPKYSGPYTVTKVVSPVVYDLVDPNGRRIKGIHVKDLKPARQDDPGPTTACVCLRYTPSWEWGRWLQYVNVFFRTGRTSPMLLIHQCDPTDPHP